MTLIVVKFYIYYEQEDISYSFSVYKKYVSWEDNEDLQSLRDCFTEL